MFMMKEKFWGCHTKPQSSNVQNLRNLLGRQAWIHRHHNYHMVVVLVVMTWNKVHFGGDIIDELLLHYISPHRTKAYTRWFSYYFGKEAIQLFSCENKPLPSHPNCKQWRLLDYELFYLEYMTIYFLVLNFAFVPLIRKNAYINKF